MSRHAQQQKIRAQATLSLHVLDSTLGKPGAQMRFALFRGADEIVSGETDEQGRGKSPDLDAGTYRLQFATGEYLQRVHDASEPFYPLVDVHFRVAENEHNHIPLVLSPHGYSTYRGS